MTTRMRAVALISAVSLAAAGCKDATGPLSAARNLEGTWHTAVPVTMYFDNDWCTSSPSLVFAQSWDATWEITRGADENSVDIQMNFATANNQIINGCPSTGVVPEVSPLFLTGNISGTRLSLYSGSDPAGEFDFTTDNIQGDFDYTWCAAFCQREYSTDRTFILGKQ